MNANTLQGKKVAILVADGFEQVELTEPKAALDAAGAETRIVSPASQRVQGWNHFEKGDQFPVDVPLNDAHADRFDALLLPGGVANPDQLRTIPKAVSFIREFFDAGTPLFGICLGQQLLGLASGAKTIKMKFGHHGANHPVLDLETGRVLISSQNHGFAVDEATLPSNMRATHRSLFDGSLQGISHVDKPAFGFQGHPEASPGPHDLRPLFEHFVFLMVRRLQQMLRAQVAVAEGAAAR